MVLIEAFPFGRRPMRFELIPLLERAANAAHRPLIACSVRDILQEVRPERQEETVALVKRFFDLVLVHGDPNVFALSDSFPAASAFEDRIWYTGMVGPDRQPSASRCLRGRTSVSTWSSRSAAERSVRSCSVPPSRQGR